MSEMKMPVILFAVIVVILFGIVFFLPFFYHPENSPLLSESDIISAITDGAASYGLTLCSDTPIPISYPGVTSAVVYQYGTACSALPSGESLDVLALTFDTEEDQQNTSSKIKGRLAEEGAKGVVVIESGNYIVLLKGLASQTIGGKFPGSSVPGGVP